MKTDTLNSRKTPSDQKKWLFAVFIVYIGILMYSILNHELWGDEVHSWNIAKASETLPDLLHNIKYEGHPPIWYFILYTISQFSHNFIYMQLIHGLICSGVALMLLFYSDFSFPNKTLLLAGYYFSFEYAALSRNYAIGILIVFTLCYIMNKSMRYKTLLYYSLLLLLCNTHLMAFILAISFHSYFLLLQPKQKILLHLFLGALVILPTIYFILPPSNSNITPSLWLNMFNKGQFLTVIQAPVKAFVPIPAWWLNHFWNTHFLIEAGRTLPIARYMIPLISAGLIGTIIYILWADKKVMLFFLFNLSITFLIGLIFPLTSARYVGYLFIGFVVALWLLNQEAAPLISKQKTTLISFLLILQISGTVIALKNDWKRPFSQINALKEVMKSVPAHAPILTDFWCLNYVTAALDKPFTCVGFEKEKSFLIWDSYSTAVNNNPHVYSQGIASYLQKMDSNHCYLISNNSFHALIERDPAMAGKFKIDTLINARGAIEKYSDIYLFKVTALTP